MAAWLRGSRSGSLGIHRASFPFRAIAMNAIKEVHCMDLYFQRMAEKIHFLQVIATLIEAI